MVFQLFQDMFKTLWVEQRICDIIILSVFRKGDEGVEKVYLYNMFKKKVKVLALGRDVLDAMDKR